MPLKPVFWGRSSLYQGILRATDTRSCGVEMLQREVRHSGPGDWVDEQYTLQMIKDEVKIPSPRFHLSESVLLVSFLEAVRKLLIFYRTMHPENVPRSKGPSRLETGKSQRPPQLCGTRWMPSSFQEWGPCENACLRQQMGWDWDSAWLACSQKKLVLQHT